jgi:putative ABC transport system permease protein
VFGYVWRELLRNPRRTLASLVGVALGVGLFSGVLFFIDGSSATMTKRALAPLSLDMHSVLNAPLGRGLRFEERIVGPSPLRAGQDATFTLTVANDRTAPANEVVVNDEPPPPLAYMNGTTTLNGAPLADTAGQSPLAQGLARSGLNLGTLAPGARITLTYVARATRTVADLRAIVPQGRISSRENVVPTPANAPAPLTLEQLRTRIAGIPGVAAADGLSFVDLPPGALRTDGGEATGTVRVFAFDERYRSHHPSIRLVAGGFAPDGALLSVEAARALGARPGATVHVRLPGPGAQLALPVTGITDVTRATPLFSSRKSTKLEDFLYVPNSVVVSPATFRTRVVPAFQAASATPGTILRALPLSEVDIAVDRTRLRADPGRALAQTKAIARSVDRIGSGQQYLVDNISNALEVARDDAVVGKRMFVFLGLPGALLAAFFAGYAGSILAGAQRREQAILRIRGARRGHLVRMLVYRTFAFAGGGAVLGTALGLLAVMATLGGNELAEAGAGDLAISALIGIGVGMLTTAVALYVPGRRSLRRDIGDERRELAVNPVPVWRRWRLDVVLIVATAMAEIVALRSGAFDAPASTVAAGEPAVLPARLLLAPILAWFGATLACVRAVQAGLARVRVRDRAGFGGALRGLLRRNVRRRSWALATGITGVALVVAFGTALALFAATYDSAKAADARFVVGSDLRITPSALSPRPPPADFADRLRVPGVAAVTPVVFKLENAVLIARYNQDRKDLAAIDPRTFERVAALSDSAFVDRSASAAMAALRADPTGLLVDARSADDLSIETGDRVRVLLARGTRNQVLKSFRVVGRFERFPGFPQGTNLVANLAYYRQATRLARADFLLARTAGHGPGDVARASAAILAGPGRRDPVTIDSTLTALDKDQSSLTALNVNGLVDLDSVYTVAMSAAVMGIFVFGLLLQRRREYVTLLAQGLPAAKLHALVLGEAAIVAVGGAVTGALAGTAMASLLVHVLRPLFVLDPSLTVPMARIALLALLPAASALVAAAAGTLVLRRLHPAELLRET